MLTPVFDSLQQRQPQDDSPTDDLNNHSVEAAMYAYLHAQPDAMDSPFPVSTISSSPSTTYTSPSSFQVPNLYNNNKDSDLIYANNNNNLFQSPQLPEQQQPVLTDPDRLLYYPSILQQQQQQQASPFGTSWGHSFLDMLQETANGDNALYDDGNNNNITTTVDPSLLELFDTINNNHTTTTTTKIDTTTTTTKQAINMEVNSFTDLLQAIERMQIQLKPTTTTATTTTTTTTTTTSQPPPFQPRRPYKKRKSRHPAPPPPSSSSSFLVVQQQQQQQQQQLTMMKKLPAVVHDTVDTFLPTLMEKAQSHWCCVGFKVAPVTLEMIRNWRQAPVTIVYCVASIALVTFLDHNNAGQAHVKTAAMGFYEQARRKMDDIVFDDENDISNYNNNNNSETDDDDEDDDYDATGGLTERGRQKAMTIQSYFCLSYTSNLLRLYEQQRTWGGLASIALQLRTKDVETGCRPMDLAILLCYCRWYYVDAWMSLTLGRDCLLPDDPPRFILEAIHSSSPPPQQQKLETMATTIFPHEHQSLFQFAMLTKFMRRYIQVMQSGKLVDAITKKPSSYYYQITAELKQWYSTIQQQQQQQRQQQQQPHKEQDDENDTTTQQQHVNDDSGNINAHLHLCYNAMRLVILYKLVHPDLAPPDDWTLMDGLDTNLALLLALQQLAAQGCDQSTYHHMFFAIHNTASRIYQHHTQHRNSTWRKWARQQLQMNLILLKGTQAYVNDVFQMRSYAEKIEQQFLHIGLQLSVSYRSILVSMEQQLSLLQQQQQQQRKYVTNHMCDDEHKQQQQQQQQQQCDSSVVVSPVANHHHHEKKKEHRHHQKTTLTLKLTQPITTTTTSPTSKSKDSAAAAAAAVGELPGMQVYKLHTAASIKKPRKTIKPKQTKQ